MAIFSRYRFNMVLTLGREPKNFPKNIFVQIERLKNSIENWIKEINREFLVESELQRIGVSTQFAPFGVGSMKEFQKDVFQQFYFRMSFVSF